MNETVMARLIMDALAVLHARGYGRLKLSCYVKDGIGAWRHTLFAADEFPKDMGRFNGPSASGSVPDGPVAQGTTPDEIADSIAARHPALLEAGAGADQLYVEWFAEMLRAHPDGVLEMERPMEARMGGRSILSPYSPIWQER